MTPTITEVEHDKLLLELLRAEAKAQHLLGLHAQTIRSCTDPLPYHDRSRYGKNIPDTRTMDECLATMREAVALGADAKGRTYDAVYAWPKYLAHYDAALPAVEQARQAVREHEANYTGWQRYWLVTSSPGHIHSSMGCSSCKVTTTYALVPSLSASTAEAAIEMFGPAMCTVCFPAAPTGLKVSKALAESVGTDKFDVMLAKHQAKAGLL